MQCTQPRGILQACLFASTLLWTLGAVNSQRRKPGDLCDGRVERWCDFEGGVWCRGGKCGCVDETGMDYHPAKQACLTKVWFKCGNLTTGDLLLPTVNCVENAKCVPEMGRRECRCVSGFREDEEGFCVEKHGP